ncbi:unnamed protein product [Psylliodes chrysocephalus]|uniref:Uncharacterized protein n=1 Tax=Psylliodes chrysocephalus TaxID=3402493 RepID=A0A9P0CL31_9CUCU|nr:unnamed protein product [Psylliodes chrysocephala]
MEEQFSKKLNERTGKSNKYRKNVGKEINKMLDEGIIKRRNAQYVSPRVVVQKPNKVR